MWLYDPSQLLWLCGQHARPWRYPGQPQEHAECLELYAGQLTTPARVEWKEWKGIAFHDAYTGPHRYQGWGPASRQNSLQLS